MNASVDRIKSYLADVAAQWKTDLALLETRRLMDAADEECHHGRKGEKPL